MTVISIEEARKLAHSGDPDTSHTAAMGLDKEDMSQIKAAILEILEKFGPCSVSVITGYYFARRTENGWPLCQPYSINRRCSDLKRDGLIYDTGYRVTGSYGRPVAVLDVVRKVAA